MSGHDENVEALSYTYMWLWGERLCLIIWHVVMPPIARGQTGPCQSLPVSTVPNTGRNLSNGNYRGLDEGYLATRSRHLSRSLAILWAPCRLTPISSRFYLNVLRHGFFGFSFFLLPSFYTQYGQFFLCLFSPLETISTSLWASLYHQLPVLSVFSHVSCQFVFAHIF